MRFGVVVLARADSSRVPGKVFQKINGLPLIEHLLRRCLATGLPVTLATPTRDKDRFAYLKDRFNSASLRFFDGHDDDPLARMAAVTQSSAWDAAVRVCSDKVFIDSALIELGCQTFSQKNLDYLYSSQFTPGAGFEIISQSALNLASAKHKGVEHVSYAVKNVTTNTHDLRVPLPYQSTHRLLIDYPDDLTLLEVILSQCGQDSNLLRAIDFMNKNPWAAKLNKLPALTVYTCAYNAQNFIQKCMGSVAEQSGFGEMEYLLIDDHSTDTTPILMAKMATTFPNVRMIRNPMNVGLASSSNVALSKARGGFILRLDADDFLTGKNSLAELLAEITETGKDAIYPNNYFGSLEKVQNGKECMHVGGTIFRTGAINHVKFTDMLRGFEGYDFFVRAKSQISIGFYGKPTFFYRQRPGSMSKTNLDERRKLKAEIDARAAASAGN